MIICQPPCEAVSWNEKEPCEQVDVECQPPCEAVSWNAQTIRQVRISSVSLLVRLWVEMIILRLSRLAFSSASLWGCELKYYRFQPVRCMLRQPPCEAVSWNTLSYFSTKIFFRQPPCEAVSWNGYFMESGECLFKSASLWGCELKSSTLYYHRRIKTSASLWGCELKCIPIVNGICNRASASLWGCELKFQKRM